MRGVGGRDRPEADLRVNVCDLRLNGLSDHSDDLDE
jgi:hypothetical protein